jgi:hypothetical protein
MKLDMRFLLVVDNLITEYRKGKVLLSSVFVKTFRISVSANILQ